jgi:demethylmenaquinone methyltransferase / 2-methoxy-6-polyprenyl-1,4-benzoquinol methylase
VLNQAKHNDSADTQPSRIGVWKMFDRIAPRYDILNRILSFGLDISWRRRVARCLPDRKDLKVLDLATGTGDLPLSLLSNSQNIASIVGLDMSPEMLAIAERKIAKQNLRNVIGLVHADAVEIPFADNSFDAVTIAFGIRNVPDINIALREMYRVLKPAGKIIILEFSLPENIVMKTLFLLYLKTFVPVVGAIISGDYKAYRYLNKTVETFLSRKELCLLMQNAGFMNVNIIPMTSCIACIYCGDKAEK